MHHRVKNDNLETELEFQTSLSHIHLIRFSNNIVFSSMIPYHITDIWVFVGLVIRLTLDQVFTAVSFSVKVNRGKLYDGRQNESEADGYEIVERC